MKVFAAGSLKRALSQTLSVLGHTSAEVAVTYGPAGLLAQRILAGERPDLYISADLQHPQQLLDSSIGLMVYPWVGNSLSLVYPATGLFAQLAARKVRVAADIVPQWLQLLLGPGVRIGTSTPHADPGGDWAQVLFAQTKKYAAAYPLLLRAKSHAWVGAVCPDPLHQPPTVDQCLLGGRCDVFVSYSSNAAKHQEAGLQVMAIPAADNVAVRYGMLAITGNGRALAQQLLSAVAQKTMQSNGFGSFAE